MIILHNNALSILKRLSEIKNKQYNIKLSISDENKLFYCKCNVIFENE